MRYPITTRAKYTEPWKLAQKTVRPNGQVVYTLGPIRKLKPFHRLVWATLYMKFGWQWAYRWVWKKYADQT